MVNDILSMVNSSLTGYANVIAQTSINNFVKRCNKYATPMNNSSTNCAKWRNEKLLQTSSTRISAGYTASQINAAVLTI